MRNELHTYIEPDVEARITALVLGEASEFEVDELERMIEGKPELTLFRRRMESIHGLLGSAVKLDPDEAWQLSGKRRAELRHAWAHQSGSVSQSRRIRLVRGSWKAAIAIAACLVVCVVIFSMTLPMLKKGVSDERAFEIVSYQAGKAKESFDEGLDLSFVETPGSSVSPEKDSQNANWFRSKGKRKGASNLPAEINVDQSIQKREMTRSVVRKPSLPSMSMAKVIASATNSLGSIPMPELEGPSSSVDFGNDDDFGDDFGRDSKKMDAPVGGYTGGKDQLAKRDVLYFKESGGVAQDGDELNRGEKRANERWGTLKNPVVDVNESLQMGLDDFSEDNLMAGEPTDKIGYTYSGKQSAPKPAPRILDKLVSGENLKLDEEVQEEELKKANEGKEKKRATSFPLTPATPTALPDEVITSAKPFSTFSLNVADVSFKLAKVALLEKGQWPDAAKVRTEEFVNAFNYGDSSPRRGEPVACAVEQSAHPFLQQRNLLRVGMKTASVGRSTPLRLTVLLDNSGSMEREDREASVLAAMQVLASQLGPQDVITLVGFARQPRLLADRITGDQAGQLVRIVANTPSEGGTNLEEALRLARSLAARQHQEGAQDRVVLITDGVANLGNTVPEELAREIETMRQQGIAFDACGVGAEGLNDDILEALTRKGDGRYYFLNRAEDADSGFAKQLAGALSPAAKNVKVQVEFNAKRVTKYRLLGFEKHRLKKEDFRNDQVDAAEMAAEEAGNAVYQIQVNPDGEGELGQVFVRFLDTRTNRMVERSWPLPYEPKAKAFDLAAPSMQLAGTAAMLGEKLHGTDAGSVQFSMISNTLGKLRGHYAADPQVQDLIRMCEKVK
ncbi:MAG: von Willebrand factor type A domain-containing protein [Verrucomicrobiae bacterium]|nr:von Willebrand factor type A domain-containing protein [Verrucomicrobiae bacterium]NNJ42609.1 DUF3520 domain-containing protein [Akkermansiaceae bacterium]